jgi:uncharacterized membrane protein YhaH (DUF805 family)
MGWYVAVLKKYVEFSGRARRTEYWMFTLVSTIVAMVCVVLDMLFFGGVDVEFTLFSTLYSAAVLLPSLAVMVRRLHDIGRSGWWYFIAFVPFIGVIVLFVFAVTDSEPGDNAYGPNPKAA